MLIIGRSCSELVCFQAYYYYKDLELILPLSNNRPQVFDSHFRLPRPRFSASSDLLLFPTPALSAISGLPKSCGILSPLIDVHPPLTPPKNLHRHAVRINLAPVVLTSQNPWSLGNKKPLQVITFTWRPIHPPTFIFCYYSLPIAFLIFLNPSTPP
ncbi:hypothetical protein B9Z19DRAFT_328085 [Tuber borchii]|uniref:Uncharacterized protein n=1 Tax=Tuber borchii TaxID=42251 RepID=A0A2T7A4W7_TUBBO|nr:hypothetical protein B9Z19DRAFT_328085 [Tuber borchii]